MDEWLCLAALLAVAVGILVVAVWHTHHWLECRRRFRLQSWQRRALLDDQPRGFEVTPPHASRHDR